MDKEQKKIAPGHRVDLSDMQGMEAISTLFDMIGWGPLLTVNELYYPEMIYEFYVNLHKGRIEIIENIHHQWVVSRIGGRDIAFYDRPLNTIIETPQDGIRFYTKNKRFEETFTKGVVLKRYDDRNMSKLDTYGRVLHHIISNIIIPNAGPKSSITNMHSFVMLALHEHRRMNFSFMAIENMLATQFSSTKRFPYGCFLTKIFQHFVLNLVGGGDQIGPEKIYNQHTFTRIGFEKNNEGQLVRGGQDNSDEEDDDDDDDEQEEMTVSEEESDSETERNIYKGNKKKEETRKNGGRIIFEIKEASLKCQRYTLRSKKSW
ncbi:hypothetical protein M9H77_06873 [Catharanthus roseus]|uniref:Uncharacterized protein n=1 Tax=Catharanthus roseus TaxID=4058 RepID=A0ACC0BTC2_CATRO|nr:hypothetical protein M9H77_06873 [Catharanthus roseus]